MLILIFSDEPVVDVEGDKKSREQDNAERIQHSWMFNKPSKSSLKYEYYYIIKFFLNQLFYYC